MRLHFFNLQLLANDKGKQQLPSFEITLKGMSRDRGMDGQKLQKILLKIVYTETIKPCATVITLVSTKLDRISFGG